MDINMFNIPVLINWKKNAVFSSDKLIEQFRKIDLVNDSQVSVEESERRWI